MEQLYKIILKRKKADYDIQVIEFQPGPLSFILKEQEKPGVIVHWSDDESYMYIKTEYIMDVADIDEYKKRMKKKNKQIKDAKIKLIDDMIAWVSLLGIRLNELKLTL